MDNFDGNTVMVSEFLSGILLFRKYISNIELINIMSSYECEFNTDIVDNDIDYLANYINICENGIGLIDSLAYNSIIRVNGKCLTLRNYLISNTDKNVICYLEKVFNCKLMLLSDDKKSLSVSTKKVKKKIFGLI